MSVSTKRVTVDDPTPTREPLSKKVRLDYDNLKPSQTLYINNLNDQIKISVMKQNLHLLLATFGDVLEVRVNKKLRGQAHILFASIEEAVAARNTINGMDFFDKPMKVNYSLKQSNLVRIVEDSLR